MTKLNDLMDVWELGNEIGEGFVRVRNHPHNSSLRIFNYTEKAQYEKHWNDITRQTRGLIVDTETNKVLARPFDKFFNVGEYTSEELLNIGFNEHTRVQVTDKMDGSLGILYPAPDGLPAIATRGSFESEQAIHATRVLRERYPTWTYVVGMTYLFEIIYPENRIVLDYGDTDDLFLLGVRNIYSGKIVGPQPNGYHFPGPKADLMHFGNNTTFARALEQADRRNAEGIVIRNMQTDRMVKVKQEDYVRLHKLVTGLNERAVWEHLSTHGGTYGGLLADVPDEFHEWVTATAESLLDQHGEFNGSAHYAYGEVRDFLDFQFGEEVWERKHFAFIVREKYPHLAPYLFHMLDGRDISLTIWKNLRPKGETQSLLDRNEDNA